ncbi:putative ZNF706/superfamily protein [Helianthus annuus]|nr:putative ZNF706/superfamily protein [Helianthus annuus]
MGGGNAQKSKMAREKNLEKAKLLAKAREKNLEKAKAAGKGTTNILIHQL